VSKPAAAAAKKKRKVKEAVGVGSGEDGPLVPRKAGFKIGKKSGSGGKSYEEVATAARRKGSGSKKAKPSRGFGKPSRG
jgi:protein MAK11